MNFHDEHSRHHNFGPRGPFPWVPLQEWYTMWLQFKSKTKKALFRSARNRQKLLIVWELKRERVKGFEPVFAQGFTASKTDTRPTVLQLNPDSYRESESAGCVGDASTPIVAGHLTDTNPVDFTALLRHRYGTDFAGLAANWPTLPENIRAAILALAAVKP